MKDETVMFFMAICVIMMLQKKRAELRDFLYKRKKGVRLFRGIVALNVGPGVFDDYFFCLIPESALGMILWLSKLTKRNVRISVS
jgi:hypothetical protein